MLKLSHVQHLVSEFHADLLAGVHNERVLEALHPTPAVGGWPTAEALAWIRSNEPFPRGWYAGPIGWFDGEGNGHFMVALRCALLRETRAWAYAGAGLTDSSQPGAEWEETQLKLGAIAESLVWRNGAP